MLIKQANFYLAFFFIAGSLSDDKIDPFGHNVGKYIFIVLRYACILVMCLQFILSMGNRPQGYVFTFAQSCWPQCSETATNKKQCQEPIPVGHYCLQHNHGLHGLLRVIPGGNGAHIHERR